MSSKFGDHNLWWKEGTKLFKDTWSKPDDVINILQNNLNLISFSYSYKSLLFKPGDQYTYWRELPRIIKDMWPYIDSVIIIISNLSEQNWCLLLTPLSKCGERNPCWKGIVMCFWSYLTFCKSWDERHVMTSLVSFKIV